MTLYKEGGNGRRGQVFESLLGGLRISDFRIGNDECIE